MTFLYHADCADGFCCAFLRWLVHGKGCTYVPVRYGEPLPALEWDSAEDVVIADFSYPPATVEKLAATVRTVTMLDHHKTAAANFEGHQFASNVTVQFDIVRCGTRLVYNYLVAQGAHHIVYPWLWLVDFIEDRDLWRWKLHGSREVSAAIASYPFDFNTWSEDFFPAKLVTEGTAILRYQEQQLLRILSNVRLLSGGVGAVSSPVLQSELGNAICLMPGVRYADVSYLDSQGRLVHSLRSTSDDVDVSAIAARYGGGGHARAAGYKE